MAHYLHTHKNPSTIIVVGASIAFVTCISFANKISKNFALLLKCISPLVNKEGGGNDISCLNKLFKSTFLSWEEINRLVTTELLFWLKVNFALIIVFPFFKQLYIFCFIDAWMDLPQSTILKLVLS